MKWGRYNEEADEARGCRHPGSFTLDLAPRLPRGGFDRAVDTLSRPWPDTNKKQTAKS
jgi:hypothetical protein